MKSNFIFVVVILMICENISCDPVNTTKTYILNTDLKASWYRANHFCASNGMRLASITSKQENDQILRLIKESGHTEGFWIGGTNFGNEPHFYWMGNKKPMTFTDWQENEPNNQGGYENCIQIRTKWNDGKCWELNNFICEEIDGGYNFDVRSNM